LAKRPRARTQANRTPTTQLGFGLGPRQRDSSHVRRCRPAAQDRSSPSRPTPRLRTAAEALRTASRHPTCPSAPFTFSAACQQSGTTRDVFRDPRLRDARHAIYRQSTDETSGLAAPLLATCGRRAHETVRLVRASDAPLRSESDPGTCAETRKQEDA